METTRLRKAIFKNTELENDIYKEKMMWFVFGVCFGLFLGFSISIIVEIIVKGRGCLA